MGLAVEDEEARAVREDWGVLGDSICGSLRRGRKDSAPAKSKVSNESGDARQERIELKSKLAQTFHSPSLGHPERKLLC